MTMRFRLRGRLRSEARLIGTYRLPQGTVQLHQCEDGQVRWSCDCEAFQVTARQPDLWCEHITHAAALRSIERLMRWRPCATAHSTSTMTFPAGCPDSR
jgi:hypothetical protein